MNKEIMKMLGFGEQVDRVERGECPFCCKKVDESEFRDELSRKDFQITGLCQACQDKTYKEE